MQATMHTQLVFNPAQVYTNKPFGGGAAFQPSHSPTFGNGRNQPNQMTDMLSGFSKTSFSIHGQATINGQTTPFSAQGTIGNRGQAGNPAPDSRGRDDHCANRTPPPTPHCGCNESGRTDQAQWTNTPVANNKTSIDLGDYKLDFSKSNSSMLLTDKKTGDTTNIYGDPHIEQHANGANKTSAMFNGPMSFMLPDNTKVTVSTQAGKNNASVSYADQVTITRGNQAYQVTGLSQENNAGLSVQKSNNGRALDAATPDGYTIVAARSGTGWVDPATGKQPTADDFKKAA